MSRLSKSLLLLAGIGLMMYLFVSLFLPSPRRMIFGVDKRTGRVRMAEQGITFLPPDRFYRLSFERHNGWAQRDGIVTIRSKEGIPLKVTYRLRFGVDKDHITDAKRLVHDGWSAWIRARVGEAVSVMTERIGVEELASPMSQFSRERGQLTRVVADHLAASGLRVTGFAIKRIEVDREALLAYKRVELRRNGRGAIGKVAVFAIEGADWELLSELIADDRMPNLQALIKGGATASLQSLTPSISPMIWTTVATGLSPDRHGVISFFDASNAPVNALSRRAPTLWEITGAFGHSTEVVSWWCAWPPLSSGAVFDQPVELLQTAISPPGLSSKAASLLIPEATVGYPQVRRFLNITQAEYDSAIAGNNPKDPIVIFRSILAKTWSDHRVGLELYRSQHPELLMMSYEGTDYVNHLFGPFHPPYREGISSENFRKYWPAVANYYSEVDRLVGEWMKVLPQDTTVIVLSGYGSRWGKDRPRSAPEGAGALQSHRSTGMMIVFGNGVAPAYARREASIYDVAPTILTLMGLPPSKEMQGRPMTWAFHALPPVSSFSVTSYADLMTSRPLAPAINDTEVYKARLQAIGHITDPGRAQLALVEEGEEPQQPSPIPPEQWGLYAYTNNLGVDLRAKGDRKGAAEAFSRAVELNPTRAIPYLNLSILLFDQQRFTNADELFLEAIKRGLPNGEKYFIDFAALYRERNMPSRAANVLLQGKQLFPASYLIAANLGSALSEAKRYTEGVPELERALGIQPTSTLVLNDLGIIHMRRKEYGRALDYWNRSLAIDPRQPQIRDAVRAVQSRL